MERKNRRQFTYNVRPGLTVLVGSLTFGALGVVPADPEATFPGVASVVKFAATGLYRVNFSDTYLNIVGFDGSAKLAAAGADGYDICLLNDYATDGYSTFQVLQGGTARDIPGITIYLTYWLKTSEQG